MDKEGRKQFSIYPVDEISPNECYLSNNYSTSTSSYVVLFNSIILKVKRNFPHLENDHIIVHSWIFDYYSLQYGENVFVEIVGEKIEENLEDIITFQLLKTQNLLSFDEISSFPGYDQELSSLFPDNFENLLPIVLNGYCLMNGGIFSFQYLNVNMVMKCTWANQNKKLVTIGRTTGLHYTLIHRLSKKDVTKKLSDVIELKDSFLLPARNTLLKLTHEAFFHQPAWIGPHSILIASPPGSGKTTLLDEVVCFLENFRVNNVSPSLVLLSLSTSQLTPIESFHTSTDTSLSTTLFDTLLLFVRQLDTSLDQHHILTEWISESRQFVEKTPLSSEKISPLLLIVENIDSLLLSESPEAMLVSHCLLNLLKILTLPTFSLPIFLVSSTSISESRIPSKFYGSPGFEIILTLPLPQIQDREMIFQSSFERIVEEYARYPSMRDLVCLFQPFDVNQSELETRKAWISNAATLTSGYLPGDLVKIVRRMVTLSLSRLSKLKTVYFFHWNDFLSALNMIPPHQLLTLQDELFETGGVRGGIIVEGRSTNLSWSDFAGYDKEKYYIQSLLNRFGQFETNLQSEKWLSNEIAIPRGLLICGESGSGKSYLAKIIASEAKMNFITIKSPSILSKYFGETEASLRKIFQKARSASPCVLFFDDFDSIAHNRGNFDLSTNATFDQNESSEASVISRILSTFLNELDGISSSTTKSDSQNCVFVIAACTDSHLLDKALLRPGRLSHQITLFPPDRHDIEAILKYSLSNIPVDEDISIDRLVELYCNQDGLHEDNYSSSDIVAICREAIQLVLKENIQLREDRTIINPPIAALRMSHFESILLPKQKKKLAFVGEFQFDTMRPFQF